MWYRGVKASLMSAFSQATKPMKLSLHVNIDGISVWKNSRQQFWPILIAIYEFPRFPALPVAIFVGDSKPANVEWFLREFIEELKEISANGLYINGHAMEVKVRCIICDSPARAFIKGNITNTISNKSL
ncbi:uncharacterized protein LOC118468186 [Anopheles albimanus]|uniref:uncharacterized protein LOC118468186 n=1 Tax=Anopheles albimanus TaxID=7167 RepID=UPI00163E0FC7|nr:uncharacterized protein LOC118468186 [Anopheles albimanus]